MNITQEEFDKIVKTTEVGVAYDLSKGRLKYNSPANKQFEENAKFFGIQRMMDKIRKIYGLHVCKSKWNKDTKSFDATCMENAKISEVRHFSYEDICKIMDWKSFKIVGEDTLKPVPLSYDEKNALYADAIKETMKRDLAAAKKAGKKLMEAATAVAEKVIDG